MTDIADRYDPAGVESRWYREWESRGLFHADAASPKKPYCIVIPPPNVTGSLHWGHALNNTLQDILIRYKRMDGYNALWVPGTDHSGIAVHVILERQLAEEGKTRQDIGREAFLERAWKWKEESGGNIIRQLKRLGASCDWSRERFTMDAGLTRAVRESFVRLYEEGLIYQDDYIVNWCPSCQTVLSDLEVEREDRDGEFVYIKYGPLTLGTVRPETKVGGSTCVLLTDAEGSVTRSFQQKWSYCETLISLPKWRVIRPLILGRQNYDIEPPRGKRKVHIFSLSVWFASS